MTDLDTLLSDRSQLASRLETIEAALLELRSDVTRLDAEIEVAKRQRQEAGKRGLRMYALLQEVKSELCRYDTLIKSACDEIADRHIGEREGAYLLNHGMIIARTRVNGSLYTAMVQIYNSS